MADTEDLAVNDVTAATQGVAALISEVGLPFHIITIGTCSSDMLLLLLHALFVARRKKTEKRQRRFWRIANTLAKMESFSHKLLDFTLTITLYSYTTI
jgi:hypothetical protein